MQQEALRIAREIAGNPPLAVQGAKRVLQYNETTDMDRSQDYNAARSAMIMPSDDLFEAVSAFMEKRAGNYKGS
jgi:enoyl-CoA hydratase